MFKVICLCSFIAISLALPLIQPDPAQDAARAQEGLRICLDRWLTRNERDTYPNPHDCHTYYRCYFANATYAVGVKHHCPPRHFWSADTSSCLPESRLPCTDQCRNGTVAVDLGGYGLPRNCAKFYKCNDAVSQLQCCQPGTRFDRTVGHCQRADAKNQCLDKCQIPSPADSLRNLHHSQRRVLELANPLMKKLEHLALEDSTHNITHCEDQFGNILQTSPANPEVFIVVKVAKRLETSKHIARQFVATCPKGQLFDIRSCRCRQIAGKDLTSHDLDFEPQGDFDADPTHEEHKVEASPISSSRRCSLYLPLDEDNDDHSPSKFVTYLYDDIEVSQTFAARGSGSLSLQGGRLEIPQMSRMDVRDQASYCLFFQCHSSGEHSSHDPFACDSAGGLLSNRVVGNSHDFSVSIAAEHGDQVEVKMAFEHPDYVASVNASVNLLYEYGFNQVCAIYDGSFITLYVNNVLMSKAPAAGYVRSAYPVFSVGTDGFVGDFRGNIDEVLVCRHALSQAEVNAHFKGSEAMRQAGLIP